MHLGNVDEYWSVLSVEEKKEWGLRAEAANAEAKKERDIANAEIADESLGGNHLGACDSSIFVDVEDVNACVYC